MDQGVAATAFCVDATPDVDGAGTGADRPVPSDPPGPNSIIAAMNPKSEKSRLTHVSMRKIVPKCWNSCCAASGQREGVGVGVRAFGRVQTKLHGQRRNAPSIPCARARGHTHTACMHSEVTSHGCD